MSGYGVYQELTQVYGSGLSRFLNFTITRPWLSSHAVLGRLPVPPR